MEIFTWKASYRHEHFRHRGSEHADVVGDNDARRHDGDDRRRARVAADAVQHRYLLSDRARVQRSAGHLRYQQRVTQ